MNERAQPGDDPEDVFRVNKGLGAFVMVTAALCESTYRASGAAHAPPAFLVRNGTGLGAIYYEGEGEGVNAFREEAFATRLGTDADQYEAMVFFSEAWVRTQVAGEELPTTLQGNVDRRECVIYEARDIRGNVVKARQFIDRSGERPRLDDFTFIDPGWRTTCLRCGRTDPWTPCYLSSASPASAPGSLPCASHGRWPGTGATSRAGATRAGSQGWGGVGRGSLCDARFRHVPIRGWLRNNAYCALVSGTGTALT